MNIVLFILTILQLFYNRIRHNTRFFALINIILIFLPMFYILSQNRCTYAAPDRTDKQGFRQARYAGNPVSIP